MEITRSALVPYEAMQMYRLVEDVAAYPEFLNWCVDSTVREQDEYEQLASLTVALAGIEQTFTTRNTLEPGASLRMELAEGPFRTLQGLWRFQPLGETGSKVTLSLTFEFSSSLMSAAFRRGFAHIADRMVQEFCRRAEDVYGAGAA